MNILYVQDPNAFNGDWHEALRRAVQFAIYGRQNSIIIDGNETYAVEVDDGYFDVGYVGTLTNITLRHLNGKGEGRLTHPSLLVYRADVDPKKIVQSDVVEDCVASFEKKLVR